MKPIECRRTIWLSRVHKVVLAKGENTSNLFSHLRERHPTLFAALTPTTLKKRESSVTQQTIESSVARGTKFSRDSPQHKKLTHAIAYHFGKDGVPLSTVERPGFQTHDLQTKSQV